MREVTLHFTMKADENSLFTDVLQKNPSCGGARILRMKWVRLHDISHFP